MKIFCKYLRDIYFFEFMKNFLLLIPKVPIMIRAHQLEFLVYLLPNWKSPFFHERLDLEVRWDNVVALWNTSRTPLQPFLYLVPLRLCTLGVEGLFTSGRRNLGDTRSGVPGDVIAFRNTRRMPLEPPLYLFSFRLCTLGRWCFGEISEKSEKSKESPLYESIEEVEKRTLEMSIYLWKNIWKWMKIFRGG